MSQAEIPVKQGWRLRLRAWQTQKMAIGISEIIYMAGLVCTFAGVWIWMGLGQALFTSGITLILTAILNGFLMEARAARNVV